MQILKSSILLLLVLMTGSLCHAQNSEVIKNYIATYRQVAIAEMQRTGVPAAIKLAQGIHETSAGTSVLVTKSNNHFGIKCKNNWKGESVSHTDDAPNECFRKYEKPDESYRDHSDFLRNSQRYAFLFNLDPTDYEAWAYGLKKAGYATNPKYPQIIIKLIKDYQLQEYTLIAMGKSPNKYEDVAAAVLTEPSEEKIIAEPAVLKTEEPADKLVIEKNIQPLVLYPEGEFKINDTKVIFVKKGTPYLQIAQQFNVPLARIFEFNEMKQSDLVQMDQLIFLQRKRKTGKSEYHIVKEGETLYDIAQTEAIRLDALLELNRLKTDMIPAIGEQLNLKTKAGLAPRLALKENYSISAEKLNPSFAMGSSSTNLAKNDNPQLIQATGKLSYYIVQPKETIYAISKKYGVTIDDIVKWNQLSSYDLKTGQQLKIYK